MINKLNKNETRKQRSLRVRGKISGTSTSPRLNVYRSLGHIYAQIIDDTVGHTLASASTLDPEVAKLVSGKNKTESAYIVGETVAKKAISKNITTVVFDRAGYLYTGRVKAVADGARSAGLKF